MTPLMGIISVKEYFVITAVLDLYLQALTMETSCSLNNS